MPDRFLRRQLVIAALTANALRPVPGNWPGIPAMFAGWLTSELAPHLVAVTAADTLAEITHRRRDGHARKTEIALAAASIAGLTHLIRQAEAAKDDVDRALVEALGEDYLDRLSGVHTDLDMSRYQQSGKIAEIHFPEA
jgi:hypothetical protein